jgi:glucans biosynthesis protein
VLATRIGGGGTDELTSARRKFVIDFAGPVLDQVTDVASVEAAVSASAGTLSRAVTQRNPYTGGLRVHFELTPPADDTPVELRAFLRRGQDYLSETWTYQWRRRPVH